jgi:DNA-binding beta-propeller fold protein YncE
MQDKTGYRTIAGTCVAWVIAAAMSHPSPVQAQSGAPKFSGVPKYEVDSLWAKLPDNWVVGPLGGACIDARDHVFVLHRQEGLTEAMVTVRDRFEGAKNGAQSRIKAPPVMEFDPQGNLVNSWGDAKVLGNYLHDCEVDKDGNVWIAAARSGFVQKYSHDGKLLLQIGKSGVFDSSDGTAKGKPLNSDAAQFFGPSAVDVDPQNGDVYVADGHGGGNTRIAVLDKNGTFLRQFRLHHTEAEKNIEVLPHCMRLSNDGLVYVCDRQANRLQAFDKMGNFKRNIDIPWKNYTAENEDLRKYCHTAWRTFPPCTLVQKIGRGTSAVSVEFSRDPDQRLIYVVNQNQREVDILDRATGEVVSTIGHGAGLFFEGQLFDAIRAAVDSKGNVYVAEDEGRRLQRFKVVGP